MSSSGYFHNGRPRFHMDRKMVVTVTLFIIAACSIVILTDMAINMMTATGDFTALQAHWSQARQAAATDLTKYASSGNARDYRTFQTSMKDVDRINGAFNELFKSSPDIHTIYDGFKSTDIKPNEISSLVIAFQRFRNISAFRKLQATWGRLYRHEMEFAAIASKIHAEWQKPTPSKATIDALIRQVNTLNEHFPGYTQSLLSDAGSLSTLIKRTAIWITVLLGILLVLTAIVFSVRGFKSIKRWEEILKERDDLARFPELDPNPVLRINPSGHVIYANPATLRLFPYIMVQNLEHPFLSHLKELLRQSDLTDDRSFMEIINMDEVYYQQNIHYFRQEDSLHVYGLDITENMQQEQKIRKSLSEKEVLLSEIHHRVKNNLAVISSLIQLQMMSLDEGETYLALQESEARVRSMAMIYEILYRSDSFSKINMKNYLEELADKICGSYLKNGEQVSVHYLLNDVNLNINQVIPAGLVVNELLVSITEKLTTSNDPVEMVLNLQEEDNHVFLSIEVQGENGNGLRRIKTDDTLSFSIIRVLLDQLDGDLDVEYESGLGFFIRFAKNNDRGSANALFQHRDSEISLEDLA